MKEYNYQFYAYLGAVFTLALVLVFGVFAALQPERMFESAKHLEAEAIERPHIRVDTSKDLEPALQEVLRRLGSGSERLAR